VYSGCSNQKILKYRKEVSDRSHHHTAPVLGSISIDDTVCKVIDFVGMESKDRFSNPISTDENKTILHS